MRFRARSSVVLVAPLVGVLTALGCGGAQAPPAADDFAARIDALFLPWAGDGSPGAAVMVLRDDEVLHARGYGLAELERREAITPETAFDLASVSKQFTAAAVLLLAERGQLALDDPMVKHLPELERFGGGITLRHLLTHTSGLPDYYEALEAAAVADGSRPDTAAAMRFLAAWDAPPLFPPGERWEYSNPGFEMLALVVERVSGQRFGAFLEESIFRPLGMTATVVRDRTEPTIAHRARGYARREGGFALLDDHPLNHIIGSGSVFTSIDDLARWDRALDDGTLLGRASLAAAWTPVRLSDGTTEPYGLGWQLGSYPGLGPRVHHSGHWLGFSTYLARYPERRLTVAVLSNLEDCPSQELAGRVVDLLVPTTLIENATVVDGTGRAAFRGDLRIAGDRIAAVGELEAKPGEPVVDASGLVLAPGFIDSHSHADAAIFEHPGAVAAVSQGVTTVVGGQDGESPLPLADFFARLEAQPAAINLAAYAGHGSLRTQVMGADFRRPANAGEVAAMAALLETELAAGALGLSTGLEYDPGIYATTEEVVALAKVAAAHGGRYVSHIRSEDRRFWEAVEEIVAIGREAGLPVQISHLKLALRSLHGQADRLLALLDEARAAGIDVTADLYPYPYWQSTLTVMFPERDFADFEAARFAVAELAAPEEMLIPVFAPEPALAGRTLAEIAALRGRDPATTLMDLIREAEALRARLGPEAEVESVIATSMTEPDIERLMAWPHINFCTDGELAGTHPRGYGSFTRVLGRSVRERGVLGLEEAVRRMTSQAAANLGLAGRGRIEAGAAADLVLLDPATVLDLATPAEPQLASTGIATVWVNGCPVWHEGEPSGRLPGRVLRRTSSVSQGKESP